MNPLNERIQWVREQVPIEARLVTTPPNIMYRHTEDVNPDTSAKELEKMAESLEEKAEGYEEEGEDIKAREARRDVQELREQAQKKRNESGSLLERQIRDLGYSRDTAKELASHVEAMSPSETPGQSHEGQSDLLEEARETVDMLLSIIRGQFAGDHGEMHAQAEKLQQEIDKVSN